MITLPTWEASSPRPAPSSASPMPKPHPLSCGSRKYSSTTSPSSIAAMPRWTISFGEKRPVSADPPSAKTNIAADIGQDRHPGLQRVEAQDGLQVQGQHEERGLDDEGLTPLHDEPGAHPRDLEEGEVEQRFVAAVLDRSLAAAEHDQDHRADHDQPQRRRQPQRGQRMTVDLRDAAVGSDPAPLAGAQDAQHDGTQPERGQHGAGGVELRLVSLHRRDDPQEQQDDEDHDRLGREHVAPGVLGRHPATDEGPRRHRRAADAAEDPVGDRPLLALVGRGRQRCDGRDHQDRSQALDQRPAEEEDGQVRRHGGDEGPGPVDEQADREGPLGPPPFAELPADQHQGRHHQGVQRDRGLQADDGGVQVRDDLGDGHVHHGGVQHHDELRGGQQADHAPPGLGRGRRRRVRHHPTSFRDAAAAAGRPYGRWTCEVRRS